MKIPSPHKALADKVWNSLPEMRFPTLGSEVEIPVYVIHNSADPEDYFFLFDFELFVERSKSGMFVRPKLKVWTGRNDLDRTKFARQFRESFAVEFDLMRAQLNAPKQGWLSWGMGVDLVTTLLSSWVAYLFLLVAMGAGKALFGNLTLPGWMQGKSKEAKLESEIDDLKVRVDDALSRIELCLHRELYTHAYRGTRGGPLSGMDYDAWPLPAHVTTHLEDAKSGSWW